MGVCVSVWVDGNVYEFLCESPECGLLYVQCVVLVKVDSRQINRERIVEFN